MKRTLSVVMLLVLLLPYARTPFCSSAGHEHAGHQARAAVTAQSDYGDDVSDCHQLMACDTSIQGVTVVTSKAPTPGPRLAADRAKRPLGHRAPPRAPLSPPPQHV